MGILWIDIAHDPTCSGYDLTPGNHSNPFMPNLVPKNTLVYRSDGDGGRVHQIRLMGILWIDITPNQTCSGYDIIPQKPFHA